MRRNPAQPLLTRDDVPAVNPQLADVSSVFNPGAAHFRGEDHLMVRVQTRGRDTVLMPARREDHRWRLLPEIVTVNGLDEALPDLMHLYDPRLTVIDDALFMVCAADTPGGCHLVTAHSDDGHAWNLIHADTSIDTRNGVLFPSRIDGRYVRLDRPNATTRAGAPPSGSTIVLRTSDDLRTWSEPRPVLSGRHGKWDELIGSGPPPVPTDAGWLHLYHGVATHFASSNIYQAGAVLLDADDPSRVLGRTHLNLLEPRTMYECVGQVPNVVFPSGMLVADRAGDAIAQPDDAVEVFYGAADTCIGRAVTTIGALVDACQDADR